MLVSIEKSVRSLNAVEIKVGGASSSVKPRTSVMLIKQLPTTFPTASSM